MKKIIVAITGASGSIYTKVLLDELLKAKSQYEALGIVMTDNAKTVWETELLNDDYKKYPFDFYSKNDFSAPFASGSANYNVMIISPCSMGTMGRIATGLSNDLITRAADVVLKERRRLICVVRETPYNLIHIRNMEAITLAGGIICPATPSFYSRPQTLEEVAATVSHRVLDLAGINTKTYRWGETEG
jgi:4-hydroxy-3-polyprenylbenzoate decarboxylase